MHVEQDACGSPAPRYRKQRSSIRKADYVIAACRQNQRKGFANGRIVIDYEYLAACGRILGHLALSIDIANQSPNGCDQSSSYPPYLYGTET